MFCAHQLLLSRWIRGPDDELRLEHGVLLGKRNDSVPFLNGSLEVAVRREGSGGPDVLLDGLPLFLVPPEVVEAALFHHHCLPELRGEGLVELSVGDLGGVLRPLGVDGVV